MAEETRTPGWHADPDRPGAQRWWNGLGWSDARRAGPDAAVTPVPSSTIVAPATPHGQAASIERIASGDPPASVPRTGTRTNRSNGGGAGVALGVMGLVVGAFGVLSAVAVVLSAVALVGSLRGGRRGGGAVPAAIGLVLGVVGVVRSLPQLGGVLDG